MAEHVAADDESLRAALEAQRTAFLGHDAVRLERATAALGKMVRAREVAPPPAPLIAPLPLSPEDSLRQALDVQQVAYHSGSQAAIQQANEKLERALLQQPPQEPQ